MYVGLCMNDQCLPKYVCVDEREVACVYLCLCMHLLCMHLCLFISKYLTKRLF